jgi:serine/threonine protein phosphatase PrpC
MGTTLTLIVIAGQKAIVGHIGDTRLYRFRNDLMEQLTNDHSLVAEQVKTGKLTKEQAMSHPTRHILCRVLGVRQFVQPEIFVTDLQVKDSFLLCSDGVCGMIDDQKINKKFAEVEVVQLAQEVVAEANAAGGKDNCTAVAFSIEELPITMPGRFSLDRFRNIISNWGNAGTV